MIHRELNQLGFRLLERARKDPALFCRKVFSILYKTRTVRPASRPRKLERARAWAKRKGISPELQQQLLDKTTALFDEMEREGEFDWLPTLERAQHMLLLSPRHRIRTDFDMCRDEWARQRARELAERAAARKPVIDTCRALLQSAGLVEQQIGNYMLFVSSFLNVEEQTAPGSEDRRRRVEEAIRQLTRRHHDPTLVRRLADLILTTPRRPGPTDR